MSLAKDLEELFADGRDTIVKEPLRFKAKLGIGEHAYQLIRLREHMTTFTEAIGVGGSASSIVSSGVVASTFFAKSGAMASALSFFGFGTAVTPIGWVVAAGVVTGGIYLGVSQILERSKDNDLIIVPKYINTPLDVIATALIELMLPVSLKMASADGDLNERELTAIQNFYVDEWGYSPAFIDRMIGEYSGQLDGVSYAGIAQSLGAYCADSKDCDKETIMTGLVTHLGNVLEADGFIREEEQKQLEYLTGLLIDEARQGGASSAVIASLHGVADGFRRSSRVASAQIGRSGKAVREGLGRISDVARRGGAAMSDTASSGKRRAAAARKESLAWLKSRWSRLRRKKPPEGTADT